MAEFKVDQSVEAYLNNGPSDAQIKKVNALLSAAKTAAAGWELLNAILDYCPVDFFNENVTNWLDNCLLQRSQGNVTEIKLSVIKKFLEASGHNQELSKKIISDYLSKIVDFCLSSKLNCYEIHSSFDILILCMKRYGSWFVIRKTQIEKHVISFLESNSEFTVNKAAIAFLYLQQIGNAGTENINHRNNFGVAVQKLCSTVHNLLDAFLENHMEINNMDRPNQEGFIFAEIPIHAHKVVSSIANRIKNVILFLIVMLKKSFTTYKQVTPSEILNVIVRGTATQYCVHSTSEKEPDFQFCLVLNAVQTQFLYLLKTLILWLGSSSLPYSFTISKILIDSLKKSQKCRCFSFNCVYQEAIYNSLKTWITISKCGLNSHFQTELIQCIRKDITPVKTLITLKIQMDKSKKQGSKGKTIISNKENTEIKKNKHGIENDELKCVLALDTLTTLFSSSFIRVDKNLIQDLFMLIMNIFNEINTTKCPHPYTTAKNRQKLYELLVSFYEQETLNTLPFLPVSLNILNSSLCDKNMNIAMACKKGLDALERLCQPVSIPLSNYSCTSLIPFSNEKEQIIGNDVVIMECVTDITQDTSVEKMPKKEINILDNRILPESLNLLDESVSKLEIVTIGSDQSIDKNSLSDMSSIIKNSLSDMSISHSCLGTTFPQSNINSSEAVNNKTVVPETDQVLKKTINIDTFTESESEPSIKRMKMGIEQIIQAEKIWKDPSINTDCSENSNIEELNSFVDEVVED